MPIPKIIHYCWFGGKEKPKFVKKCIKSWKKYCPDYEIREWNESNSNLEINNYVKEAYQAKKWAFVSDVIRLHVLAECGGFYMDTDVELVKSLNELLPLSACFGFESKDAVMTGFFGASPQHPIVVGLLENYQERHFLLEGGNYDFTTNVVKTTEFLTALGLVKDGQWQQLANCDIYPVEYFSPKCLQTGFLTRTSNTIAIHHFDSSWLNKSSKKKKKDRWKMYRKEEKKARRRQRWKKFFCVILGEKNFNKLKNKLRR